MRTEADIPSNKVDIVVGMAVTHNNNNSLATAAADMALLRQEDTILSSNLDMEATEAVVVTIPNSSRGLLRAAVWVRWVVPH